MIGLIWLRMSGIFFNKNGKFASKFDLNGVIHRFVENEKT